MEEECTPQFFLEKFSNIKFRVTPTSGSRAVRRRRTDGQTDKHDEANSRFPQFCERAYKSTTNMGHKGYWRQSGFRQMQSIIVKCELFGLLGCPWVTDSRRFGKTQCLHSRKSTEPRRNL
jgi:hypothetical protein